jgi:acyl-CoA synthetase (AMP-forming)/AMP-acid ligase II
VLLRGVQRSSLDAKKRSNPAEDRGSVQYRGTNVHLRDLLARGEARHPALTVPGGASLDYERVRANVDALALELSGRGIAPGERVAASLPNGAPIVLAFFATACARATSAPLNPAYTLDEYAFYLEDIAPKAIFVPPGGQPLAREAAARLGISAIEIALDPHGRLVVDGRPLALDAAAASPLDGDVALFLHTSGTTSRPKGVPLTHRNLCASAQKIARWYELSPADVSFCVMPLFHVHGLVFSTIATLFAGASEIVAEKFSASTFWPTVAANHVTIVSAVPTIYRTLLLRADEDGAPSPGGHSLRFMRSSSAALPASEMRRLEERFGVPAIEAYSMTEASHQMCANPLRGERRPGSAGVGAFVDVAVMDPAGNLLGPGEVGEVVVRGENVTQGYHNNPAANADAFTNGWFRTGDSGKLDAEGYLTLVGRLKELINRGGEKISPVEIDDALLAHPGVIEAVAFGIPDEKYGEAVAAAVVVRPGTSVGELRAHVAARIASFKVPSVVHIVDAIPRTPTGKVQRRIVAAAFDRTKPEEGND